MGPAGPRGQPLAVFAAIIGCWVAARAAFWEGPSPYKSAAVQPPAALLPVAIATQVRRGAYPRIGTSRQLSAARTAGVPPFRHRRAAQATKLGALGEAGRAGRTQPAALVPPAQKTPAFLPLGPAKEGAEPAAMPPPPPPISRWSGDGWVVWRSGATRGVGTIAPPAYGASQWGAVLRYRLFAGDRHRTAAYARLTGALTAPAGSAAERDAALGLTTRPIARAPIAIAAELRASRFADGSTHLRPAAFAVSQLPPLALPMALEGEAYAAAGYVGGAAPTGFGEGEVRVTRRLAVGPARWRLGGGAWGGIQAGARRLDIGPSISMTVAGHGASARLTADWRFRVAGDATPGSGLALTLSTGF